MSPLTERILAALAPDDTSEGVVADALQQLAEASTNVESARIGLFEDLFGPLERLGRALEALERLAAAVEQTPEFSDPLREAHELAYRMRQATVGTALDVVAGLTTGQGAAAQQPLAALVQWLYDQVGETGELRIFTLNYDALVDSASLQVAGEQMIADMAYGYGATELEILPNVTTSGYPLRDDNELTRRLILYHLHGSLQWLRQGETVWKTEDLNDLRASNFWQRYAAGDALVEPTVILADQKTQAVDVEPFDWAYRRFQRAFQEADGLLIAGYGLGDEPVNRVLKATLPDVDSPVIWIDLVDHPEALRNRIHEVVPDLDDERLFLHSAGLEGIVPNLAWS